MAQKKYTDGNGVSEIWLNIKNWVTSQLLGYSQTGHTHSADDVSNVVTTNTTQDISSQKTITNNHHFDRRTNLFTLGVLPTLDSTLNPTWFLDNNGSYFAWHQLQAKPDGTLRQVFQLRNKFLNGTVSNAEGSSFLSTGLEYGFNSNGKQYFVFGGSLNCNLIPLDNQTKNIGSSSYKWNNLYVKNGYVASLYINGTQFLPSDYAQVNHTHSISDITSGLATVATSGSYNDLSNKPTIPTVNNATLTIQKNGSTVKTFTANASSNVTANITVPTKTSELTNNSHVSITTETDTTSTGTPAHGGTFTCIDSVTRDSNGHVTKVNTKTVTLPSDSNTDTLVTQNVSTANENHPILLSATKNATTNQGAKTSIFASGVKVNPSTNTVTATTFSGTLSGNASSATQFSANKDVTLTGDVTGTASSKAGWSVATTLANSGVTAGTYGPGADVTGNNNATISVPEITVDAKGRVTSVTNRTLTCKNNTYNVYNKTLTIQKNGTNVAKFTSNSNTNVTANITVPTKVSELTNDSGFLTGVTWNDVNNKPSFATVATSGSYNDLSDKPSPYTPPTFTYDSSTETLTVSNTTATVITYDAQTEKLEVQING